MLSPAVAGLVAAVVLFLVPDVALAWSPGTHVYIGEAVLRTLAQLPAGVADLIRAFPYDFLYGSIAADTSIAKKYVVAGRHCHSWAIGYEIRETARDEPLRSFALGYLAHLAADVIAHNHFVPMRLAVTSSTSSLGHSYWESRIETHLGERASRAARDLILRDHTRSDAHLDRILSPTIFSTQTNRRIFRGMVFAADTESWQRISRLVAENSRWDLPDTEIASHLEHAYDAVMDLLARDEASSVIRHDPSGDEALRLAKRLRREALRRGGEDAVREEAASRFGLPAPLGWSARLPVPLYPPVPERRRGVS